jgi:hypothetical protein
MPQNYKAPAQSCPGSSAAVGCAGATFDFSFDFFSDVGFRGFLSFSEEKSIGFFFEIGILGISDKFIIFTVIISYYFYFSIYMKIIL